jgi:cholest-4-en-3-one 26-monooxygenase
MSVAPVMPVDLSDPATFAAGPPHEFFTWLRNEAPVWWHPPTELEQSGFWVCTKYRDVIAIERDVATFSSARGGALLMDMADGTELMMLNQDAPQHTRLRMLVARGFTPKIINSMTESVTAATRQIVAAVADKGEADFVTAFAAELPLVVISELIGVPYEDRHKVFEWSNRMIGASDPEYGGAAADDGAAAAFELYAYAQSLADDRKARPMDDLVTQLVTGELEGEKLSDIEFNVFVLLLSVAGNETTRNLISGGMLALLQNPDQRERLLQDMGGLPLAVDEMLRYVSPVQYFRRTATTDTELRGVPIEAGQKVTIWYGAANRDEEIFERGQEFDALRTPNEHLAFGGRGPHYCLGASLAKLEIRAMFEQILGQLPDMQLAGEPQQLHSNLINGIRHLPVTWNV